MTLLTAPLKLTFDATTQARIDRIKQGNSRIWDAYHFAMKKEPGTDEWDAEWERIRRAVAKLDGLCMELEATGFDQCLEVEPTCKAPDKWCWACPAKRKE